MAGTVEPGYTTTEFWATQATALVAQAVALLTVFGVIHWSANQQAAVFAIAQTAVIVAEGFYALSRGIRKSGTTA